MGNQGSRISLLETVIIFVFAWVLVARWDLVVDNLAYRTLALNRKSTFHSLIVAITLSVILILFIWILDYYTGGQGEHILDAS